MSWRHGATFCLLEEAITIPWPVALLVSFWQEEDARTPFSLGIDGSGNA